MGIDYLEDDLMNISSWAGKMAQEGKALASKPEDLGSNPGPMSQEKADFQLSSCACMLRV